MEILFENIPQELKADRNWLNWEKRINGSAKPTKIPLCPKNTTEKASTTNPKTWGEFAEAKQVYEDCGFGIGLVLRGDLIGIDIDHCIENGEIQPHAQKIIDHIDSYTEVSPSGTGIRILCRGIPRPLGARHKQVELGVEIYDCNSPRYLTMTGNVIEGRNAIQQREEQLQGL